MTLERRIDLVQQQTAELELIEFEGKEKPPPLTFEVGTWNGEDEGALTSPLRISKKSSSVLSAKEGEDEVQEVEVKEGSNSGSNSALDCANTTSTNPDSSYSNNSFSHTQRFSDAYECQSGTTRKLTLAWRENPCSCPRNRRDTARHWSIGILYPQIRG
ncbi:hypothetical protein DFP72DRAFT_1099561 [Ephemerocybe angulata]|uniref:Uncharacterized protein n=1 Tax=Ephemerocybe angulata TaxID=980116 RepID=A0A8H6HAR7_9AGAR|nr:hypothetical protein DFP72DRAFT_1099561 [Tulosesus angulatus]